MKVFDYIKEEDEMIEQKLDHLVEDFPNFSREAIFDKVKLICDTIKAHMGKESALILDPLDSSIRKPFDKKLTREREALDSEIEALIMVHVDEPGYRELLKNLLMEYRRHIELWKQLESELPKAISPETKTTLEENFKEFSHALTGFNTLPNEPNQIE